ncbi:ParB N-terminal domain-containing protein [Bacillus velezensis]|nr:ParB N-terminal domain-containing protein [Bacillus velezensis]
MNIRTIPVEKINPATYNPRIDLQPGNPDYEKLKSSINKFGTVEPLVWNERTGNLVGGHQRFKILMERQPAELEVSVVNLSETDEKILNLALNKTGGDWDEDKLEQILRELNDLNIYIDPTGFSTEELEGILDLDVSEDVDFDFNESGETNTNESLVDRFIIPPFSIFDARQGYWQERKRAWHAIGISSDEGREENLLYPDFSKYAKKMKGTSIFDPVLCEIIYKWFNIDGGKIYDPFAGGSVRGIVASFLNYEYYGIDIREEQVKANKMNAATIEGLKMPNWICDDSLNVNSHITENEIDLMFSCPPYGDLEVYSDNPNDISTMEYDDFVAAYSEIIKRGASRLKNDRFAVFVVGDIRDKKGIYRNFVDDTKKAFLESGLHFYNEIVLINAFGTAGVRAANTFVNRKVVKVHQNVLVFYKGDPKNIKDNFKEIDVSHLEEFIEEA